jgi:hypothetical protein
MKQIALVLVLLVPPVAFAEKTFKGGNATWDCKKDPVVWISEGKGTYVFKGNCKTIDVGSGMNTLTIESVDDLRVRGGMNKISVDTVDIIWLSGAKNTVRWKRSKTRSAPKLEDSAAGNDVAQVK